MRSKSAALAACLGLLASAAAFADDSSDDQTTAQEQAPAAIAPTAGTQRSGVVRGPGGHPAAPPAAVIQAPAAPGDGADGLTSGSPSSDDAGSDIQDGGPSDSGIGTQIQPGAFSSLSVKQKRLAPAPTIGGGGAVPALGGGVTCGVPDPTENGMTECVVTAKSPNRFEVSQDLASMSQHMGAHGGMTFTPSNGYSVGFYPGNGAMVSVGGAPPFPNQGCTLAMWISAKPGGAPYGGATFKEAAAAGCAISAFLDYSFAVTANPKGYGCVIPAATRSYLNVQVNMDPLVAGQPPWWGNVPDWNGKFGWREKICDSTIASPLGGQGPDGPSAAEKAEEAASAAQGAAETAALNAQRAAHPCNVCAYNNGGGSCMSCNGDPVNCKICPAGTPGPQSN